MDSNFVIKAFREWLKRTYCVLVFQNGSSEKFSNAWGRHAEWQANRHLENRGNNDREQITMFINYSPEA